MSLRSTQTDLDKNDDLPKKIASDTSSTISSDQTNEIYKDIGWFMLSFICFFFEQLCELCAPFLFVSGLVWLLLPWLSIQLLHLTSTTDVQTHNAIVMLSDAIPTRATLAGYTLSGKSLVLWGIVFMMIAALCAAANNYMHGRGTSRR